MFKQHSKKKERNAWDDTTKEEVHRPQVLTSSSIDISKSFSSGVELSVLITRRSKENNPYCLTLERKC